MEDARQFVDECKARFMKMNLDAFMVLFSRDATKNTVIPFADIREAYRGTISHSKSIIYNFRNCSHTGEEFYRRKIMFETGLFLKTVQREFGNSFGLEIVKRQETYNR